ncbi:unnamed protein product [Brachionus calyciflorus]|uniref:Uncharacterized protein n=1 Tax=Brachionus calyciflorus TaxID=104777 RepID=A0A813YXV2_9BILA|nr:unnamed protein product [Brachionus calyciflorus]
MSSSELILYLEPDEICLFFRIKNYKLNGKDLINIATDEKLKIFFKTDEEFKAIKKLLRRSNSSINFSIEEQIINEFIYETFSANQIQIEKNNQIELHVKETLPSTSNSTLSLTKNSVSR